MAKRIQQESGEERVTAKSRPMMNRRRRTGEGPEPACVQTPNQGGWRTQGRKDELTSCRGTVSSAWQKPPVRRKGGRAGLPKKGKWPPRGTGTTVLTYPGSAPWRTGKAGENCQNSGEMGGSSAWTRPSAPECGDTLKALAGDQRPIQRGDRPRRRLRGRCRLGSPASRTPPHGGGSMYRQANVRAGKVLRSPIRALPSVIVDTEKVLREADGSVKLVVVRPHTDGKVFALGCASRTGR